MLETPFGLFGKTKIAKTKNECVWDIVGYSVYLGFIVFLNLNWNKFPEKVHAHYNVLGDVERWGTKAERIILPNIGVMIAVMMQLFEKFPEIHNYPNWLNKDNARKFYLASRKMVNQLKNICLTTFVLILFESVFIATGFSNLLGKWLLSIILVSVSVSIIVGIINQEKD